MKTADLSKCRKDCKFYEPSALFELCKNEESEYQVDGEQRIQFHTIRHMREHSACRPEAVLYRRGL